MRKTTVHRLLEAGITLNEKCEFSKTSIKFLAHIIDRSGIQVDLQKTHAIAEFPNPSGITELQRFMGTVNHQGKFIPRLSEINEPLRYLLRKDSVWSWGEPQKRVFCQIKSALASPEVLAHHNSSYLTIVSADASN